MDITNIILGIILIIGGLGVGGLSVLVKKFIVPFLKNRLSEQSYAMLAKLVKDGVRAAEQLIRGSGMGAEKKEYVLKYLEERGYIIDREKIDEAIDVQIEAAVKELNIEQGSAK